MIEVIIIFVSYFGGSALLLKTAQYVNNQDYEKKDEEVELLSDYKKI